MQSTLEVSQNRLESQSPYVIYHATVNNTYDLRISLTGTFDSLTGLKQHTTLYIIFLEKNDSSFDRQKRKTYMSPITLTLISASSHLYVNSYSIKLITFSTKPNVV